MRTKTRLMLWLGVITLLVFVLAGVALGTIWKLSAEGQNVLKANYNSIEYAQRMFETMDAEGDTASRSQALLTYLTKQQANITEPGEADLTEQLARSIASYRASPNEVTRTRALRNDINSIIEVNRAAIVRKADSAQHRAETAFLWISLAGTLCFLITFTLFVSLPQFIAEPIRRLTEGIDRIAAGNYRERVAIEGGGEFGHMADRFNAMAGQLEKWENSSLARIMDEKARAEAVINSLQDASIGLDEQGRILFVNRQALELLGLEASDAIDRPAVQVAQGNDLLRMVLDDKASAPFKAVRDGKENYFISSSTSIQGSTGALGTVYTVRNITPFQERDQAKTYFLATISHELKTPLASTDIGLTLLERQGTPSLSAEQKAILADLRKDHQRLVRIVSELLDLAQVESGHIQVNTVTCVLDKLIEEALGAVKMAGLQKDLLFARPTGAEGQLVIADPDKAIWVLVNVLGNAVRHSPRRGIITLVVRAEGERVILSVSDQGPGVPAAERDKLFERFMPGSGTDHGSGLGLSIAHEFMLAMGGSIAYEPSKAEGATFALAFATA